MADHEARNKSSANLDAIIRTITSLHKNGNGLLTVEVFLRKDFDQLYEMGLTGSDRSYNNLIMIAKVLAGVASALKSKTDFMLCAACDSRLRTLKFSVVVVRTEGDERKPRLGLPICFDCGTDHASVTTAALKALKNTWPDLSIKRITHPEGGHA